jgi:ribonuclease BN (tRNA processing enzyme)
MMATDIRFEITLLGTGSCVPSLKRGSPGLAVEVCEDSILIDGGSGTLRALLKAGLDYRTISHLLYTHVHPDHTGDLVPFLLATRYTPGFARTQDLRIWGPPGFRDFFRILTSAYPFSLEGDDYEIEVSEVGTFPQEEQGWRFSSRTLRHPALNAGYRIEVPDLGRTLVVTGDTEYCPELVELAKDADLLICECSFPDDQKAEGHLTPSEVGRAAEEAGVRRLILTHLYPACDREDIIAPCRKYYGGPVEKGEDLMRISLSG